jgi:putative transposase
MAIRLTHAPPVLDALRMALTHRRLGRSPVGPPQRRRQPISKLRLHPTLDDHNVQASKKRRLAESFVDSFKTELIRDRAWQARTQLELAIVGYVAWFNTTRLHQSLGDTPFPTNTKPTTTSTLQLSPYP